MDRTGKTILVVGATGRQGRTTIRHLVADGWNVRALSRNIEAPAALALRREGVHVVQGDATDRASLTAAMQGIYGVFCVQPALDYDNDLLQGKNVAEAAREADVSHFIYTSVGGAQGQAAYRRLAKWEIEQHIWALGLRASILRPAWFMEDIIGPRFSVPNGTFATPIVPAVVIYLIAIDDIGAFVALAFDIPAEYLGKTIEIAGEALTPPQLAATISAALGRSIPYVQVPIETIRWQNADVAGVYDFLNAGGLWVDIASLRRQHPDLMDFRTWLEKDGATLLQALPQKS